MCVYGLAYSLSPNGDIRQEVNWLVNTFPQGTFPQGTEAGSTCNLESEMGRAPSIWNRKSTILNVVVDGKRETAGNLQSTIQNLQWPCWPAGGCKLSAVTCKLVCLGVGQSAIDNLQSGMPRAGMSICFGIGQSTIDILESAMSLVARRVLPTLRSQLPTATFLTAHSLRAAARCPGAS